LIDRGDNWRLWFRDRWNADGPSIFRSARFRRAQGAVIDRPFCELWRDLNQDEIRDGAVTLRNETIQFVIALRDASLDERGFRHRLARRFVDNDPINPDQLSGRERTIAFAFYAELGEEVGEYEPAFGAFATALKHRRHAEKAQSIMEATKPKRGLTRALGRLVSPMVDDFLLCVMLAGATAGLSAKFAADVDDNHPLIALALQELAIAQQGIGVMANQGSFSAPDAKKLKLILSDLTSRALADRFRKLHKEFG
jgi:hypothetical protein